MDVAGYMTKWMYDIVDSRNDDGSIPDVAPAGSAAAGAPGWSDIVVTLPWSLYTYYGDTRLIEEHQDSMEGFLAWMRSRAKDGLFSRGRFGDWVSLEPTPREGLAGAYQVLSTRRMAQLAAALGQPEKSRALQEEAETLQGLFNERYFDSEGHGYAGGSQTAQVLPLAFGIVPEAEREPVAASLAEGIRAQGTHLTTGFLGTAHLMPVLSENGLDDLAAHLAKDTRYPSWGYMVESGATTIWERWNGNQAEAMESGMNSFNHFAFGIVSQWYYEYLLGIQPAAPGYKRIRIAPRIEAATWARGGINTMYGPVRCDWNKEEGFQMVVEIPANTRAIILPPVSCEPRESDGVKTVSGRGDLPAFEVGSGIYHFVATAP